MARSVGGGRTLVVTNDFPPRAGGIESFVLAMTERMPPEDVVVYTANRRGGTAYDAGLDFPVIRDRTRVLLPTPAVARRVAAVARAEGCDRVWFGAAAPLGLLAPALRRAGVRRTVATTHGHEIWWATVPGTRQLLHRIGEVNDVVTHLGDYCRNRIGAAFSPAARARMVQLNPGVDDTRFVPDVGRDKVRERHGLADRPVVVCVSRMVARKGQDVLVEALPELRRRVPGTALLLVGDGPYRSRVADLAERLGVADHGGLTGRVPGEELPHYYAAGDVFCMPARSRLGGLEAEGLGICYLEAAAAGLPVVAGDSGGAPDAVLDGENGFVLDGRDVAAVTDRCATLLADPGLSAAFGARGREWVAQSWRWDGIAVRLQRLLAGELPD
ncbi:MAG: glycosyltransferase family 4 protein [Kineosporiaceae bacterium]